MMKINIILFLLATISFGANAQHDHATHASHNDQKSEPSFKDDKVGNAYSHYIQLKNALVASSVEEAKKAANALEKALAPVSTGKKAQEASRSIASSSDLTLQRKTFSALSNEMTILVKASKLTAGSLYVEYCPMANNNEGAFWLSNAKQIKNPYFGDAMLMCGSVKETIQ